MTTSADQAIKIVGFHVERDSGPAGPRTQMHHMLCNPDEAVLQLTEWLDKQPARCGTIVTLSIEDSLFETFSEQPEEAVQPRGGSSRGPYIWSYSPNPEVPESKELFETMVLRIITFWLDLGLVKMYEVTPASG